MNLENNVLWMGYRKTVGEETAGFDLLISLSFAEGLPINLIEAGWAGTPVLTTWVDGNRDLFPTEEFGALISPFSTVEGIAEKLNQVISNSSQLEKMGKKFQSRVINHFSGEAWLKALEQIYKDLPMGGQKLERHNSLDYA